jgi:acyl-CoA synthetase (AMP-forming)/AMP-acid ligase II
MVELIVTADMALVSLVVAVLKAERVPFTVNPAYGVGEFGYVSNAISSLQRIMVRTEDAPRLRQWLAEAKPD